MHIQVQIHIDTDIHIHTNIQIHIHIHTNIAYFLVVGGPSIFWSASLARLSQTCLAAAPVLSFYFFLGVKDVTRGELI